MTDDEDTQPKSAHGVSVWTVQATLAAEVRPTEAVFSTCTGVAMFVHGRGQQVPYVSDCRGLYANGRKV